MGGVCVGVCVFECVLREYVVVVSGGVFYKGGTYTGGSELGIELSSTDPQSSRTLGIAAIHLSIHP